MCICALKSSRSSSRSFKRLILLSLLCASCDESSQLATENCPVNWPETAIRCVCVDSAWQCTFEEPTKPEPAPRCLDVNKPENAEHCECIEGHWNCTFSPDDPCATKTCPEYFHCNAEGECTADIDPCAECGPHEHCENHQCIKNTGCSTNDDCNPDQTCIDGTCNIKEIPGTSPECNIDDDCHSGEICMNGSCTLQEIDIEDIERLLSDNLVKRYKLQNGEKQPEKRLRFIDFSSPEFVENMTDEYTKDNEKTYPWNYHHKMLEFRTPADLSEYNGIRFSVYVPEDAVQQSFNMCFQSGNNCFGHIIPLKQSGWNDYEYALSDFEKSGNPKGWAHIDKLILNTEGMNQNNADNTTIYLGNFELFKTSIQARSQKIIDFSSPEFAAKASTEQHKTGEKSYQWAYKNGTFALTVPKDLSEYRSISLWTYVPQNAVGQTFLMYFTSDNPDTEKTDSYSYMITLDRAGWVEQWVDIDQFRKNSTPLGWNRIDRMTLTAKGWSQDNSESTTIYLDDIYFHTFEYSKPKKFQYSGALFSTQASRSILDNQLIDHCYEDIACRVYKENDEYWLPLSVIGTRYDDDATYQSRRHILKMTWNGNQYRFEGGKDSVEINGHTQKLDFTVKVNGSGLFVPEKYFQQLMGYPHRYENEMGMLYLSHEDQTFDDLNHSLELMYEMLFIRPDGSEIITQMDRRLGGDVHPRIMLRQSDFEQLKSLIKTDERAKKYLAELIKQYGPESKAFQENPIEYPENFNSSDQLPVYRQAKNKIIPLALLYKLTDDTKYLTRALAEVTAVCKFKDWQPGSYLNTAEILYAVAIAYDWLYADIKPEQRQMIEKAVHTHGLMSGLDRYEGRASKWGTNNWSGVCNGGLTSAALAFAHADDTRESAQHVLNYAIRDVENGMYTYAPDGGYLESPMYWAYGTDYLHVMFSALDSATGSTYGLYPSPGFAKSAYFTTYLESPAGSWGFHDSSTGSSSTQIQPWFAKKSQDTSLAKIRRDAIESGQKSVHAYDLMWYSPDLNNDKLELSLDAYYSQSGIYAMHSSWDNDAILTGLHGGYNKASHGDLDIGNFILYAGKHQFIVELGPDNYTLPQYFGASRYTYYRKRAEGQNTLVIGDVFYQNPDQNPEATGKFLRLESNPTNAISIVDMTTAYETAAQAQRGLWFKDGRTTIVVQDEVMLKSPQIVRWAVHTQGNIELSADGRSATIRLDKADRYLYVEIVSPDTNLKFTFGPANSYDPAYPKDRKSTEKSRDKFRKLMITPDKVSAFNTAVVFKVIDNQSVVPSSGSTYQWRNMSSWSLAQ